VSVKRTASSLGDSSGYLGQGYDIEVPLPDGESAERVFARIPDLFERQYAKVFAVSKLDEALEIVNWKVEATGPETSLREGYSLKSAGSGRSDGEARKGTRPAYLSQAAGYVDCPVHDRYALVPGDEIVGPALIEERESTCVIGAGDIARVDAHSNLIVELSG
jgi:N-methylhydantoinase A